jgi:flagellar protein FliO/FliZ
MDAPSTAELMLRMVLSLAIMAGVLWLALRLARSRRAGSLLGVVTGPRDEPIRVVARRQLSRNAAVALVQVGHRTMLLATADSAVQVLAEGDDLATPGGAGGAAAAASTPPPTDPEPAGTRAPRALGPGPARMGVVHALRELTVRR